MATGHRSLETQGMASSSVADDAAVFAARAEALARPVADAATAGDGSWLRFRLGRETYAIATRWVVGVARPRELVAVPGTPERLLGVVNVRGQLLPVFDLRRVFGVQARGIDDMGRLLLLGARNRPELGVFADEVEGRRDGVAAQADAATAPADPCLSGIAADGTLIIDGQALLADPRFVMEDAA